MSAASKGSDGAIVIGDGAICAINRPSSDAPPDDLEERCVLLGIHTEHGRRTHALDRPAIDIELARYLVNGAGETQLPVDQSSAYLQDELRRSGSYGGVASFSSYRALIAPRSAPARCRKSASLRSIERREGRDGAEPLTLLP